MKLCVKVLLSILFITFVSGRGVPEAKNAASCDPSRCKLPSCRCSSTDIPGGLSLKDTPQFVLLTFDDAVNVGNYRFYQEALTGRSNRDKCPAAATFFVSHEYTDYSMVHNLYKQGHEIALHSITHNVSTEYWKHISVPDLRNEFVDERQLIANFANIPQNDIQGIRLPFLQLSGDNSFEMMSKYDFLYDCSWPTRATSPGLWPYTLEYASTQDCVIGPCPEKSWKNVWVLPMLVWLDEQNRLCSMVDACVNVPNTTDKLVEFMKENFVRTYQKNKAPFGFYVHAAWFNDEHPYRFEAYKKFINYLQSLPDVYLVGGSTVINWVRNPQPLSKMTSNSWSHCRNATPSTCTARTCKLSKGDGDRYMRHCASECPNAYPWVNNPLGK